MKLFSWLSESGRHLHFLAGAVITAATFVLLGILTEVAQLPEDIEPLLYDMAPYMCVWTSLVAGFSVEVKDERWGGKLDLLDVLATMLPSLVYLVASWIF